MSSKFETESFDEAKSFAESIKSKSGRCQCMIAGYGPWRTPTVDFIPRYEISKDTRGYVVKVWYVCANCGRELR